jgi:predicted ester cyclase
MIQIITTTAKAGTLLLIIAVVMTTGCQQKPDPSLKLKPIVDKYIEVWNGGDPGGLDAIIDPHFVRHINLLPENQGLAGAKEVISGFRTAYPDLKFTIADEVYSENKCAARWVFTGTNTGPGQMPPTGKPVKSWGVSTYHFANGRITEEWVAYDSQSLFEQLGYTMMPPSGSK